MKNALLSTFKKINFVFLYLVVFFLFGCTQAKLSIEALTKELPAPSLKTGGISSVDFPDYHKYLAFSGTCDIRTQLLKVAFKELGKAPVYYSVPSTMFYDNTLGGSISPQTTKINDINCSDGSFDFILSRQHIFDNLGITTKAELDAKNIEAIYIAGETLVGMTKPLIMNINNGGGNNPVATKIKLIKNRPTDAAGINQCFELKAKLTDASGNHASLGAASSYKLVDGASNPVNIFNDWTSCHNAGASQTLINFSTNNSEQSLIVKAPPSGSSVTYQVQNYSGTSLDVSTSAVAISLKATGGLERYVAFGWNTPYSIASNQCYPITVEFNKYDSWDTDSTRTSTAVTITSSLPGISFYSESSCSTALSTPQIPAGVHDVQFFMKYTPPAAPTETILSSTIDINGTGNQTSPTTNAFNIASDRVTIRVDDTANTAVSRLSSWIPQNMEQNKCYSALVETQNFNHTSVPIISASPLNYSSSVSFDYYSSGCYDGPIAGGFDSFAALSSRKIVYVVPTGTGSGGWSASLTTPSLSAPSIAVNVSPGATMLSPFGAWSIVPYNSCFLLEIQLLDASSNFVSATNPIKFTFNSGVSGNFGFSNNSCSSPVFDGASLIISPNINNKYTVFVKAYMPSLSFNLFITAPGFSPINQPISVP